MPRLSRRALLTGAGSAVVVAGAAGTGVQQGWLPGRPWAQAHLGLNGEAGVVPDVEAGPVVTGSFVSQARGGVDTGWALLRPPGATGPLPLVVALHGLGADHASLLGPRFGLDRFLAATVADGTPPYALATVDGGTSYWHPRPDGEDASAMVVDELLPVLAEEGVTTDRFGLLVHGLPPAPSGSPASSARTGCRWSSPAAPRSGPTPTTRRPAASPTPRSTTSSP